MSRPAEKAALDQWYCIEALQDIAVGSAASRLLGVDLVIRRDAASDIAVTTAGDDTPLPTGTSDVIRASNPAKRSPSPRRTDVSPAT